MSQSPEFRHHGRLAIRKLPGVQIVSMGSYVPDTVITNGYLKEMHGFDPEWIVQRTGILERRRAAPGVGTSDLAVNAARQCMERAGVRASDVDLLLMATVTPDSPLPSAACRVQEKLGLQCPAMDVQAACAGFMYAMITATQYIMAGTAELALVIGGECLSRICNPADQKMYPLFGDAAGAALLARGRPDQGLLAYSLGADGTGADLIRIPMGGSREPPTCDGIRSGANYMQMDGRAVFKWATRILVDTFTGVTEAAGYRLADVNLFVAHQANIRIIDAAAETLGIPREKVFTNLHKYGNTSAASVPLCLDDAIGAG